MKTLVSLALLLAVLLVVSAPVHSAPPDCPNGICPTAKKMPKGEKVPAPKAAPTTAEPPVASPPCLCQPSCKCHPCHCVDVKACCRKVCHAVRSHCRRRCR